MSFANIFSHSVGCLLVLLIVSFAVQKLFILMRSQSFIFAFVSLTSGDMLSKKLLQLRSKRFYASFSSRILMSSCLTFRSFIHFEFIFVYGVRKWSRFILLLYPPMEYYSTIKKNEILPFVTTWMELGIMLSEISQRKINI